MDEKEKSLDEETEILSSEKFFELRGNSIFDWLASVVSLLSVSKLVEDNMDTKNSLWLVDPSLMLKGYAVECFLKSIWLSMGKNLVENGEYVGIQMGDLRIKDQHNLVRLSQGLGLKIFDENDERFINTLTLYSKAYGRYPIPMNQNSDWEKYIPDDYLELYGRIIKKLASEIIKYPAYKKEVNDKYLECIVELVK